MNQQQKEKQEDGDNAATGNVVSFVSYVTRAGRKPLYQFGISQIYSLGECEVISLADRR